MKNRCIHIFPEFKDIKIIEKIRELFDPLFGLIPPHITLVFPFESDISTDDLVKHLKNTISEIKDFNITLQHISAVESFGFYLFLNISEGTEQITELHNKLYSGLLEPIKPSWLDDNSYRPHITVGKLKSEAELEKAFSSCESITQSFNTKISKVVIETILHNEESQIEYEFSFLAN